MFTQEEEDFLKSFVTSELARIRQYEDKVAKELAIQNAILARDAAFATIKNEKDAEIQIAIQPFEDSIEQAMQGGG